MGLRRAASAIAAWFTRLDPSPDVFAVVMATGVVSVAARDHSYRWISLGLGLIAVVTFVVLGLGFVVRAATHPSRLVRLTRDPDVALRMFTFVAACSVLDARLGAYPAAGWVLGGLGLAGWVVLTPLAAVDIASRPAADLRDRAHGAWLLPSVATSGLAASAAEQGVHVRSLSLVVVGAAALLLAVGIYIAVASVIVWRALAAPFTPAQVPPDSWILMGALAICALAGSGVLAAVRALGATEMLVQTVLSVTLVAWIAASLWIPVLLYAQMWRTDHMAGTLHYQGAWWSAVFPIGMYSAASAATGSELRMPALATISLVLFWVAFTVWTLVGTGLLHTGVSRALQLVRRRGSLGPGP
ncbi:MAG: tellurite resistance/C4-dicarboxylate transporter family protein [Pseudonocardia sp.]|nr:tellurite resistance/C4-dicarboxylate transporter family protein [Pseudonocardia sp.]